MFHKFIIFRLFIKDSTTNIVFQDDLCKLFSKYLTPHRIGSCSALLFHFQHFPPPHLIHCLWSFVRFLLQNNTSSTLKTIHSNIAIKNYEHLLRYFGITLLIINFKQKYITNKIYQDIIAHSIYFPSVKGVLLTINRIYLIHITYFCIQKHRR